MERHGGTHIMSDGFPAQKISFQDGVASHPIMQNGIALTSKLLTDGVSYLLQIGLMLMDCLPVSIIIDIDICVSYGR